MMTFRPFPRCACSSFLLLILEMNDAAVQAFHIFLQKILQAFLLQVFPPIRLQQFLRCGIQYKCQIPRASVKNSGQSVYYIAHL